MLRGHGLRVCENRVLWRASGPNMGEIIRGWGRLHNELNNLYSPNIRMITLRRMKWTRLTPYIRKEDIPCFGRRI
jgi:hypothetical protein